MSPPAALAKARKLILQEQVDVMVGIVSSGVLGAVLDMVHGAGVPLIVANAGNDEATGASCSPYITRISFSNGQINRPMGTWMTGKGVVDRIITNLGVLDVTHKGLHIIECADGVTRDDIIKATEATIV